MEPAPSQPVQPQVMHEDHRGFLTTDIPSGPTRVQRDENFPRPSHTRVDMAVDGDLEWNRGWMHLPPHLVHQGWKHCTNVFEIGPLNLDTSVPFVQCPNRLCEKR